MCVQCVTKPSILPATLTNIERIIEENSQTLLQPRLLLQRPRIRNIAICGIFCISYINKHALSLNLIQMQTLYLLCKIDLTPVHGYSLNTVYNSKTTDRYHILW